MNPDKKRRPVRQRTAARRVTRTSTRQRAGCYTCHGDVLGWHGANAQVIAARHTDATGHETWVEASLSIGYSREGE